MANLFTRTYTFVDGTTAYGSQVEAEVGNIVTILNSLNTAGTNWGQVSSLHATNVPLIADCAAGTQDIADFKNNNVIKASIGSGGQLTLKPTTNQIVLGTTNTVTISSTAPSVSRTYTMPDVGGSGTFPFLELAQTFTAKQTLSAAAGNPIHGTNTNDSASAGFVGEVISSVSSQTAFPSSTHFNDLTSIALTAGDWMISIFVRLNANSAPVTEYTVGVSATTGDFSTGLVEGDSSISHLFTAALAANEREGISIPFVHVQLSGNATYYLKYEATYASGAPQATGRITALRIR